MVWRTAIAALCVCLILGCSKAKAPVGVAAPGAPATTPGVPAKTPEGVASPVPGAPATTPAADGVPLKVGMTQDEVVKVLGSEYDTEMSGDSSYKVSYDARHLVIYFTPDGHVKKWRTSGK